MVRPVCTLLLFVALGVPAFAQSSAGEQKDEVNGEARQRFYAVRGRVIQTDELDRLEGELDLGIESERARLQDMQNYGPQWSSGAHLLWDGPLGATLRTNFDVEIAGDYDLSLQFTRAVDYGKIELFLTARNWERRLTCFPNKLILPL